MSDSCDPNRAEMRLVTIGLLPNAHQAQFGAAQLQALGISATVVDELTGPSMYMGGSGIKLVVREMDRQRAQEVLCALMPTTSEPAKEVRVWPYGLLNGT